ncbi:MAG: hypothetical protein ACJ8AI_29090 [Rhodopila sp.]
MGDSDLDALIDAGTAALGIPMQPEWRQQVPLRPNIGIYTQPISFIGLPVVVVPLPTAAGLPIGVQIITAPWREDIALRIARTVEAGGIAAAPRPAQED